MLVDLSQISEQVHSASGIHIVYAEDADGCIRQRSGCADDTNR
jgi:hypothetical protein